MVGRRRFANEAEDFASWAVEKRLNGSRAKVSALWADYLRHEFGDTRPGRQRKGITRNRMVPIATVAPMLGDDSPSADEMLEIEAIQAIAGNEGSRWSRQRARAIVMLMSRWEFTSEEVAQAFGVSRQCVSLWLSEIRVRIKGGIK